MAFHAANDSSGLGGLFGDYGSFLRRFARSALPFWSGPHRWRNRGRVAALLLLSIGQVAIQVSLNFWSARLYNAIEQRAFDRFLAQMLTFAMLLVASMTVFTLQVRAKRRLQFAWRVWLSNSVLDRWMDRGRQHQLDFVPGEHDNPDGRIAEDARIATESAVDLGQSLFYCVLLLVSFVDVLWTLSGEVHLWLGGTRVAVPGHLVWIALAYSSVATSLALWVGRPLVGASNLRQTLEADFRFGLVHARENTEAIALIRGEADERGHLLNLLEGVRAGWERQTASLTRIMLFTSAYSLLATPFPILVAAPRYIMGMITLGALMQTAQAFQQVTAALSWPVDNLATIAQWRASAERVLAIQDSLAALDRLLASPRAGPDCPHTRRRVVAGRGAVDRPTEWRLHHAGAERGD
jgi:vitamin B12/bleomycin/antimicrobial peptide transport system ATP-binding/permease protein